MGSKEFKTIEEQIKILKDRGLDIPDEKQAYDFLKRNNYYRVSGYSLTLRSHDVFNQGATFQNIVDIYEFDHALRHILLCYIELIEVTLKSVYSYEFTKSYGAVGYLESKHFSDPIKYKEITEKTEKQKKARLPHEAYLKHFIEDLHQNQIPLWAYVDLFTISDISFLYSISEPEIKNTVAKFFGLDPDKKGAELLKSFMHSLTIIRNLCAHGSRLFNRLFEQKPWLNKKELSLLRVKRVSLTMPIFIKISLSGCFRRPF
ncbi:Abi family protein [bacterium]|nr:Abi family protein [bacterium]